MDRKEGKGLMLGALLGGLAGAAAGILFAPKSGKKTREDLKLKAEELANNVRTGAKKFNKDKVEPVVEKLGEKVEEVGKKMQA